MCGIAGFFDLNNAAPRLDTESVVTRQIATLHHRGPDAQATFAGPGVGLAHARLSIIDLSAAANQPMFDATGKIGVVFNGEIYNFQEVREHLEARGHVFSTNSDTEVIVEGYAEWGVDVLDRLQRAFV